MGTPGLRAAIAGWVSRACGASGTPGVLPTIGSKELVAWLPTLLGVGPGDIVVIPSVCYPTYEVGVQLAGATVVRSDSLVALGPDRRVKLVWINSPSNPTGKVLPVEHLRKVVAWARERGAVVASDECYLALGWEAQPVSILDDAVTGGDYTGVLAVHSLSKRSNLAGYRAGFVAGDPALVAELLAVRKHGGMIVPAPVQAAMIAALGDETHVLAQRERYAARRDILRTALVKAGFEITHSEAGLYLWSSRGEECWQTIDWLAERGILAAPGAFYGPSGSRQVRIALTATDERVAAAAARLT
jgi:succinyldiaminopimelate transaminase